MGPYRGGALADVAELDEPQPPLFRALQLLFGLRVLGFRVSGFRGLGFGT